VDADADKLTQLLEAGTTAIVPAGFHVEAAVRGAVAFGGRGPVSRPVRGLQPIKRRYHHVVANLEVLEPLGQKAAGIITTCLYDCGRQVDWQDKRPMAGQRVQICSHSFGEVLVQVSDVRVYRVRGDRDRQSAPEHRLIHAPALQRRLNVVVQLHESPESGRARDPVCIAHPGPVSFGVPSAAEGHSWDDWRDSVAQLYDRDVLVSTRHKTLDGRLFLLGLGLIDASLKTALDDLGAWGPLVVEIDEAVAATGSPLMSVIRAVQFGYGYQSDRASGQDQLGVQGEVNAVCEVILDANVKPPLAVGLFGEWGTGKSFFMEKMRERVAERTRRSEGRPSKGNRTQLHVVQIRFNAWHYADTSLWASLAIEIFDRLADPEPAGLADRDQWLRDRGDVGRAERLKLLTQLETYRDAKAALDAERMHLEAERSVMEHRREEASRQRREAVANMSLTDVAGELAKNKEVKNAIAAIFAELAVTPAVGELLGLGAELRTTAGYLPWVWRLVRHKTLAIGLAAISWC
jgi:hypothetical protein